MRAAIELEHIERMVQMSFLQDPFRHEDGQKNHNSEALRKRVVAHHTNEEGLTFITEGKFRTDSVPASFDLDDIILGDSKH